MQYFDPMGSNWTKRVLPHLNDEELQRVLIEGMNKFVEGRWGKKFLPGDAPRKFESCDWGWGHRGREPRYWQYVKHSACHWLVNFNLRLATLVMPKKHWHIVTSDKHSTVWDGKRKLFDLNFCALGIPADEAYSMAAVGGEVLECGEYLDVHFADRVQVGAPTP